MYRVSSAAASVIQAPVACVSKQCCPLPLLLAISKRWQPGRAANSEDTSAFSPLLQDDGLTTEDIGGLIDNFPGQPLDFFGALRASTYDNQIRRWITEDVIGTDNLADDDANWAELGRRLVFK